MEDSSSSSQEELSFSWGHWEKDRVALMSAELLREMVVKCTFMECDRHLDAWHGQNNLAETMMGKDVLFLSSLF